MLAFAAGTDLLLGAPDAESTRQTAAALRAAFADGAITPERLDTSVRRVLRFKLRWGVIPR